MWGDTKEIEIELNSGNQRQSNFFQVKEGKNKLRLLAGGEKADIFAQHGFGPGQRPKICFGVDNGCPYHGEGFQKPSMKVMFYVLDRSAETVVIQQADLAWSIRQAVLLLSGEEDYKFTAMPMPYDITITYNRNAQPADMYKVIPSPKTSEVPAEILAELAAKDSLSKIIAARKAKAKAEFEAAGKDAIIQPASVSDIALDKEPVINLDADIEDDIKPEDIPF